jgi:hypothetical protein
MMVLLIVVYVTEGSKEVSKQRRTNSKDNTRQHADTQTRYSMQQTIQLYVSKQTVNDNHANSRMEEGREGESS